MYGISNVTRSFIILSQTKQQGQASKEVVRAKARGSCILMSELPKAHAHFEKKTTENKKKKSLGNQILNQDLCKAVSDREKKTGNVVSARLKDQLDGLFLR